MKPTRTTLAFAHVIALMAIPGPAVPGAASDADIDAAGPVVDERRPADLHGEIDITLLTGRIEVIGWDKPEIDVSGSLGSDAGKLDLGVSGARATLRVIDKDYSMKHRSHWGSGDDSNVPRLTVRVPRATRVSANLVSADLVIRDLAGEQELRTVSGTVTTTAQRAAHVHTVSGNIDLSAGADSTLLELGSVSGTIRVTGGRGDVSVDTISGDGTFSLGTVSRANFKTVSGRDHVTLNLSADGNLEAESVSGDIVVEFVGAIPAAQFHLESFSGNLKSCFGPKVSHEDYGPGSRFEYTEGAGTGRVHMVSKSGDLRLCTKP
jgi:hypothetical protein